MKIIFALPGNHFSNNFLLAWTELFNWCIKNNIEPIMVNRYTSNVYHVRNMCLGGDVTKGARQKPFQGNIAKESLFTPTKILVSRKFLILGVLRILFTIEIYKL